MRVLEWTKVFSEEIQKINASQPTFIAGSRTMSAKRIAEIAKKYIVTSDILWGTLTSEYIEGFKGQPQYSTLDPNKLERVLAEFEKFTLLHSFTILQYDQKDLPQILENLEISRVIFINASWHIAFHRRPEFQILERKSIKPKLISPFIDEVEAKQYAKKVQKQVETQVAIDPNKAYSEEELLTLANAVAKRSFDYTWQTGAVLSSNGKVLVLGHNRILPYETYMWHTGSLKEHGIGKERELSQMHNLNTNDTLHAEMDVLIQALNQQIDLKGTTLYVSLMPCPNCARAIAASKIERVVYENEHFGGLAEEILQGAGKELFRMQ